MEKMKKGNLTEREKNKEKVSAMGEEEVWKKANERRSVNEEFRMHGWRKRRKREIGKKKKEKMEKE